MKKIYIVTLVALGIFACAKLPAQSFSLISEREPVVSLDGLWRFHTGDNPAWADPSFDDSQWPLIRSDESWTRQGYPAFNGYAWYRFTLKLPAEGRFFGLLFTEIANGYQVYADGKLIGSAGASATTRDPVFVARRTIFSLPPASTGSSRTVQIALRVWTYLPTAYWAGAGTRAGGNEAGDPAILSQRLGQYQSARTMGFVNEYAYGLISGLIGLAILALFLLHPADKEYLWFSILLLALFADAVLHISLNLGSLPLPLWNVLRLIAEAISMLAAMAFFSIVLNARRSRLWWAICILIAASPLTAGLIYFQWTGMGVSFALAEACILLAYLWIICWLVLGTFRRDVSARLLVVPVTLSYGMSCAGLTARIIAQLKGSSNISSIDIDLLQTPFHISLRDVVDFTFFLALLVFLMRRFSLARKEEERMATEFEAAKTVQSLLIPAVPPCTPGFVVESVYLPAHEVGGDFFQVLPGTDGSLLIVVGDVSGKGLKEICLMRLTTSGTRDTQPPSPTTDQLFRAQLLSPLILHRAPSAGGLLQSLFRSLDRSPGPDRRTRLPSR